MTDASGGGFAYTNGERGFDGGARTSQPYWESCGQQVHFQIFDDITNNASRPIDAITSRQEPCIPSRPNTFLSVSRYNNAALGDSSFLNVWVS